MRTARYNEGKGFIGRIPYKADLLDFLTSFVIFNNIKAGRISAIGAVSKASVAFYDQDEKIYKNITFDKHLEILNLTGNISIKDGKPFIHAHITFGDENGNAFGGHLAKGTEVFACEFIIKEFLCEPLERTLDKDTGLGLWNLI